MMYDQRTDTSLSISTDHSSFRMQTKLHKYMRQINFKTATVSWHADTQRIPHACIILKQSENCMNLVHYHFIGLFEAILAQRKVYSCTNDGAGYISANY